MKPRNVIIVGAGLAGLACANRLVQAGLQPSIIEATDSVGGRVSTDNVDGFLLDRGFQVYLTAYPSAGRLLNLDDLNLHRFRPGALVLKDAKLQRVMDVFRSPRHALGSAIAPIGSFRDKLLVAKLRLHAVLNSLDQIAAHPDTTTEDFLRQFGFSDNMIDDFFRSFYGGIFLERELQTSSRMFEFTFKMFTEGFATLPAAGMQAIPKQLAARLPAGTVELNTRVRSVEPKSVKLENGTVLEADCVVVATDANAAATFLPGLFRQRKRWRSTATLYFSADRSPLNEALIALNGTGRGLVNNVCVPSDVAPAYAPRGKSLVSVSVLGLPSPAELERKVLEELG
ncbi:MAG: NAD(P)/FAD-dependent oxidoreductase, partial [Verrucomicrobia bacterium]|nr:NAD(P)/FAD-dependent oxidoreductase [Verrucomicrobiota bacterium]